jgi:hypothetical protein
MAKKREEKGSPELVVNGDPGVTRRMEVAQVTPHLYVNGFQVIIGPLDIRLHLFETFPSSQSEIVDRRLLSLIMTPETMRLLANALPRFVKQYEEQFGKLRDITSKDKEKILSDPEHS